MRAGTVSDATRFIRRPYIIAAIGLAAFAAVWHFWLSPRWTMRVPRNANSGASYFGVQTNADAKTGVIPTQDVLTSYKRTIRVIDAADWPRSVLLQDQYTARDIQTGAINYEYITDERVDPETGAWSEGPHKGDIVLFPRDVGKRTYTMRSNYMAGVPLKFSEEDDIGGLEVYLFAYRGAIDLTAAYAGTAASPGVKVPAGQEIRCADDQFYYRAWVRPLTGEQAKVEEGCMSGDFMYDKVTGNKLAAVDRWNGVTSGSDLDNGVTETYIARRRYALEALYVPGILIACLLGILAVGFSRGEMKAHSREYSQGFSVGQDPRQFHRGLCDDRSDIRILPVPRHARRDVRGQRRVCAGPRGHAAKPD